MNWKTISSKYLSKHIYFTAREDRCEMPDGRIVDPYFVVEMPPSVCAMAITEANEVILVKQYRHPIGDSILELPGGFIDEQERGEAALSRELLEETGYQFSKIHFLGSVAGNPGVLNNFTGLYLATGGKKIAAQKLDHNEEIEILLYPLQEVKDMLMRNEIKQALHATCLFYGFNKLEGLK